MSSIAEAIDIFNDDLRPHVKKLHFLKEACFNGILGEDPSWSDEYYRTLSSGLGEILEEIADAFDNYYAKLDEAYALSEKVICTPTKHTSGKSYEEVLSGKNQKA